MLPEFMKIGQQRKIFKTIMQKRNISSMEQLKALFLSISVQMKKFILMGELYLDAEICMMK